MRLPRCNLEYDALDSKRMCHQRVDNDRKQASNLRTEHNWFCSCDVEPTRTKWTSESRHCHDYPHLPSKTLNSRNKAKRESIINKLCLLSNFYIVSMKKKNLFHWFRLSRVSKLVLSLSCRNIIHRRSRLIHWVKRTFWYTIDNISSYKLYYGISFWFCALTFRLTKNIQSSPHNTRDVLFWQIDSLNRFSGSHKSQLSFSRFIRIGVGSRFRFGIGWLPDKE